MLEITTTRHNPLVDPHLAVWSWEIPVYLFLGGIVAGMMVLAGINLLRIARGDDPKRFFSVQTPIFAIVLLSLGMFALFLDLAHKLYVWRVYVAVRAQPRRCRGARGCCSSSTPCSPHRRCCACPTRGRGSRAPCPAVARASDWLVRAPRSHPAAGLGERRARRRTRHLHRHPAQHDGRAAAVEQRDPRSAVPVLRAFRGRRADPPRDAPRCRAARRRRVSSAARSPRCGSRWAGRAAAQHRRPADPRRSRVSRDRVGADRSPARQSLHVDGLARRSGLADRQRALRRRLLGRASCCVGIVVPLALQGLELGHRIPHTVLPALLVLVGGFTLRWVMVRAGQLSHIVQAGMN